MKKGGGCSLQKGRNRRQAAVGLSRATAFASEGHRPSPSGPFQSLAQFWLCQALPF